MFSFKFERTNEGNYEALIDRRFSNLDWCKERREKMGGEDIEGMSLKIVIKPSIYFGEKYYTADFIVNDFFVIDEVGSGYTLKACKEEINDWFVNYFWDVVQKEANASYWGDLFTKAKDYYEAWQRGKTPHQQKQLEELKKEVS
jgi:hypothetical protein